MISKHDVVGGGKLAEWQLDVKGQSQHVTSVQHVGSVFIIRIGGLAVDM